MAIYGKFIFQQFPPQVGEKYSDDTTVDTGERDICLPPYRICYVVGGHGGNGDLTLQAP